MNKIKYDSSTNRRLRSPSYAQSIAEGAVSALPSPDTCITSSTQFRVVLGLGPGRSGTKSLNELLASQKGCIHSEHEMIVPRVYPRAPSGRIDITSCTSTRVERGVNDANNETKKGSWGSDRRLEWDAPNLARGEPPRTDEEKATWRVMRIFEQRKAFEGWARESAATKPKKLGARGWREHNAHNSKMGGHKANNSSDASDGNASKPVVAAVGSVGLAYVHEYIAHDPSVRIVVLLRPSEEVVASFLTKSKGRNHWQRISPISSTDEYIQRDKTWDKAFPNMSDEECKSLMDPKDAAACGEMRPDKVWALKAYVELYNDCSRELSKRYPENIRIYDMEVALNDLSVQEDLLRWCGFNDPEINIWAL